MLEPLEDSEPIIDPWVGGCLIVTAVVTMSLLILLQLF